MIFSRQLVVRSRFTSFTLKYGIIHVTLGGLGKGIWKPSFQSTAFNTSREISESTQFYRWILDFSILNFLLNFKYSSPATPAFKKEKKNWFEFEASYKSCLVSSSLTAKAQGIALKIAKNCAIECISFPTSFSRKKKTFYNSPTRVYISFKLYRGAYKKKSFECTKTPRSFSALH